MQLDDKLVSALREITVEWNKAERAVKLAEQVCGEIVNPAIYELRYAGRRIIEAISKVDEGAHDEALKRLGDALFDCYRARHDSIDAATSKITSDLDAGEKKLGASAILQYFPDAANLLHKLSEIREHIAASREDRENRDKIYATIESDKLPEIVSLYRKYRSCEPLMKRAARRQNIIVYVGFGIGILGAVLTVFTIWIRLAQG